jgi:hypothetical protein
MSVLLCAGILLAPPSAGAQSNKGAINGTVVDQTGEDLFLMRRAAARVQN